MADSPPSIPSRFLSSPSSIRQLSGDTEPDYLASLPAISLDATAAGTGELDENPQSFETYGSHLTSDDKLTDLPALRRASPTGRPTITPRAIVADSVELSSALEGRVAQTSASPRPGPGPTSHSLSESVADRRTTARQRISFDSDRGSSTSPLPSDRQLPTASEPVLPSALGAISSFVVRAQENAHGRLQPESRFKNEQRPSRKAFPARRNSAESHRRTRSRNGSPRRSPSPSRAMSPLRSFLGRFSPRARAQSREEPFIPIDPFRMHPPLSLNLFARCCGARQRRADVEVGTPGSQPDVPLTCACVPFFGSARFHNVHLVAFDTLPRQLYLHSQLRLPSLYFSRVARIFEDAAVSRPEIQRILDVCEVVGTENVNNRRGNIVLPFAEEWVPPNVSPALARFKHSWESFVDSLVREWKTLNVLSALLLSAILTLFQVQDAANDPLTRTAALSSLVSAMMSLSYGILYIIRFGTMRSMYRASRWAEEAQKTETAIFWNVWVLLALPGVWLAWSVLAFVVAIMSFVWRTGARDESHAALTRGQEYGPRVGITCQLLLGLVYFAFVIRTFKSYGESGRRARVVRRLTDVQVELETREWAARVEGDDARAALARESEDGTRDPARSRISDSMRQKEKPLANELGLSGMDRKQEGVVTTGNSDVPVNESYSSLGM